jgi:phage baseplate assembly protein W
MTRRSPAQVRRVLELVGRDLSLSYAGPAGAWEDADLVAAVNRERVPRRRDLVVAGRIQAATQALVNRLKTHKGELAPLGHPEYGSRHHELIGEPNVQRTRNLVKLCVLEALSHEPRIASIDECRVYAPHSPPRDQVRIEITLRLHAEASPVSLVVPFFLEAGP